MNSLFFGSPLPPQILLGLALPIILYYRSYFSLTERITSERFILPQILLSSIAFYLISHAVLFKLYLPQRYTEHSLRIVFAIAGGIALSMLIDKLLEWGGKKTIASGITIIIFLLLQVAMIYSYLPIFYFNRTRSLLLTGLMVIQILGLGSSGFCVETRSILIEYPQNSPKSLAQ